MSLFVPFCAFLSPFVPFCPLFVLFCIFGTFMSLFTLSLLGYFGLKRDVKLFPPSDMDTYYQMQKRGIQHENVLSTQKSVIQRKKHTFYPTRKRAETCYTTGKRAIQCENLLYIPFILLSDLS